MSFSSREALRRVCKKTISGGFVLAPASMDILPSFLFLLIRGFHIHLRFRPRCSPVTQVRSIQVGVPAYPESKDQIVFFW